MKYRDIPQLPHSHYEIHVGWRDLENQLEQWDERAGGKFGGLDLDPDYQREHVWTQEQRIAYVEYVLMGGEVGRKITWNSPDWMGSWERPTELVDGKQRLEAVRAFLRSEFPAFGHLHSEYEDKIPNMGPRFEFQVCKLGTREEILRLYLNINAGGTPHTQSELNRVRALLEDARTK
jgi:hypothetical protein